MRPATPRATSNARTNASTGTALPPRSTPAADFLISQLFYNVEDFLEFEDYLRSEHGVKVPIVPGVLPFLTTAQIKRFTALCGSKLPESLCERLEAHAADDEAVRRIGARGCANICRRLIKHGVPGVHVYCLNRVASTADLLAQLRHVNGEAA